MMSLLSCRVEMAGIRELLDGKIWEWDLSFRWEWGVNGNEVVEMGGNLYEKSVPAHLYYDAVSAFHNEDFCETRFSMLCTGCLELTTEN